MAAAILGFGLLIAYVWHHRTSIGFDTLFVPAGPFRIEAAWSALRALIGLVLINVSAWAMATPVRRLLSARADPLIVSARLGLGLLLLSHGVLLLASVHLLVSAAIAVLLAAPASIWAVASWRRRRPGAQPRSSWPLPQMACACGALLVGSLPEAFLPFYGWDALTYHLAIPERYLSGNGLYLTPFSPSTAFPSAVEMLYVIGLAIHGPTLAKLIHLEFGVLVLWTAVAIGFRRSARCGLIAAAVLLADPLFLVETTVAYNDLALMLYALLAVEALGDFREGGGRSALVRCGLFTGAGVATRYPGALVGVCVAATLVFEARRIGARASARAIAIVTSLALLVLCPWLLRNLVLTGNPLAPFFQGVVQPGAEYFDPIAMEQQVAFSRGIGMGRSLDSLLLLPWNVTMRSVFGLYSGSFGHRVGPLYLIGLVAAALLPTVRRSALARLLLMTSGMSALLWWATEQETRFLMPALALLTPAAAEALDDLGRHAGRAGAALMVVVVVAMLLAQVPAWGAGLRALPQALGTDPRGPLPDPADRVGEMLRRTIAPGERVLLVFESRAYLFRGLDYVPYHILEASPTLQWLGRATDARDLRCRVEAQGITHVVVNTRLPLSYPPAVVPRYDRKDFERDIGLVKAFLQEWTTPVFEDGGVVAVRVKPISACRGARQART